MRPISVRTLLVLISSAALAAVSACAASDDGDPAAGPPPGTGTIPATDASANEAGSDAEGDASVPRCSSAGWCVTSLPDTDLTMKDIWFAPGRTFAIAESPTLGVKVLEWREAESSWAYIDDNTQNEVGGRYAGAIWAPGDDEVYYAAAPNNVFHGTRRTPPETGWSWSHHPLEDNSHKGEPNHNPATDDHGYPYYGTFGANYAALGVWGTGSDDVYAWYSNTIYHWKPDGSGTPAWVAEYIASDPDSSFEHLFFVSATGSGPDDVWFSGGRGEYYSTCPLALHKTAAGYQRVVDGVVQDSECVERQGTFFVGGAKGWITDLQSTGAGAVIALKGARDVARLTVQGGNPSVSLSPVQEFTPMGSPWFGFSSLWRTPDELWLTGWGLVVRGGSAADPGAYEVSTISLNGAPLDTGMYRIRGTSSTNIWAIGNGYALHKTTL